MENKLPLKVEKVGKSTVKVSEGPTPGSGVDPLHNINPNTRLKKAYRDYVGAGTPATTDSMKVWARQLAALPADPLFSYAETWLLNKADNRTDEKKARRARVRTGRSLANLNKAPGKKKKK